jgi:hypothetical protein
MAIILQWVKEGFWYSVCFFNLNSDLRDKAYPQTVNLVNFVLN